MKSLSKAYTWVLLAPALLPLFYIDGLMYPMMTPKTLALRAFGIIALALFTYLALGGQSFFWERLKRWQTWIPVTLLLVAYLASLSGIDFYRSFWSTFERGDGLLTLTVCSAYFYLIILTADEAFTSRFLRLIAWVGSIAGLYVLIQWLNIYSGANLSFIAQASGRVGGTMGNAAFLAAYLGMAFFVTRAVLKDASGWQHRALVAGSWLELLGIALAATRGTLLALIFIGAGVLVYEGMRSAGAKRTWALRGIAGAAALVILFFVFRGPLASVPFEPIKRIASISLTDATVSSRLFLWEQMLPETLSKPILGWGAEHIDYLFNRIYDPTQIIEEWFDRSHNAYLDYLIQFGAIGLALYLALIAAALVTSFDLWRRGAPGSMWRRYGLFLFLGFITYALQNFFVFDTGVTLWLLVVLTALVLARETGGSSSVLPLPHGVRWVGAGIGAALLLLLIPIIVRPLEANRLAFTAYLYHVSDVNRTKADTEKGLALGTYGDLEFGYNAYFEYTNEQLPLLKGEDLTKAYESAVSVLKRNYGQYPYDARTGLYLLQVMDSAPTGTAVDSSYEQQVLKQVIDLSPKRPQSWYILANIAIGQAKTLPPGAERTGLYQTAVTTLRDYIALVPSLSEPHFVLAELYVALGDAASAAKEAALGKASYVSNLLTAKRAVVYYEKTLDLPNAKFFLEEILTFEPGNEAAQSDLDTINAHEKSN